MENRNTVRKSPEKEGSGKGRKKRKRPVCVPMFSVPVLPGFLEKFLFFFFVCFSGFIFLFIRIPFVYCFVSDVLFRNGTVVKKSDNGE